MFQQFIFNEKIRKIFVPIVLLLALVLRIGFSFTIGSELRWYDEKNYHSIAESLAKGEGFESTYNPYSTTRWAPLQGYIVGMIYKVFGPSPYHARIIQAFFSVMICYLIFWLGAYTFNDAIGLVGSMIFAVHPVFIYSSNLLYPAVNFTLLSLLLFVFFLKASDSDRLRFYMLAGVFLGLAMLCKPVAIFFIPAIFFSLMLHKSMNIYHRFWKFSIIMTCSILMIIPWTVKNYLTYNKLYFITTEGAHSLGATNNPNFSLENRRDENFNNDIEHKTKYLNEEEKDKVYLEEAKSFILSHPLQFVKLYTQKFVNFWRLYPATKTKNRDTNRKNIIVSFVFYGILFSLSLLGLIFEVKNWRKLILYFGFVLFFAIGYSFFLTSVRYRLPIEPYIILFSASGLYKIVNFIRNK